MNNSLTKLERPKAIYLAELKTEYRKRRENNLIKYFEPTGKQESFINVVGSGNNFISIFSASNANGKTALMANILGACIFGNCENNFLDYSFFKSFPFPHRARIASTPKNLEEIGAIQTEIKKWWPKGRYIASKKGKQYDSEYQAGDWIIDLMSYEQDVKEFEAVTL